jgi:ribosome modulation factor
LITDPDDPRNRAFNLGSDSRLRGDPASANPYIGKPERATWLAGWRDVHAFWASWVRARSGIKPLPPVRYTRAAG